MKNLPLMCTWAMRAVEVLEPSDGVLTRAGWKPVTVGNFHSMEHLDQPIDQPTILRAREQRLAALMARIVQGDQTALAELYDATNTLVRMGGGVHYPPHRHTDTEELYMLEGDFTVEGQLLRAGDYCAATAGSIHGRTYSEGGCTFIFRGSEPEEVPEPAESARSQAGLVFVRASEGAWKDGPTAGLALQSIFRDPVHHAMTALVRMRPGARLPRHRHLTAEQTYMLEGDGHEAGHVLYAGDFYQMAAGSLHDITYTEDGCVFLLIASRVELLG